MILKVKYCNVRDVRPFLKLQRKRKIAPKIATLLLKGVIELKKLKQTVFMCEGTLGIMFRAKGKNKMKVYYG